MVRISVLVLCAALAGCTQFSSHACPQGLTPATTAELFFGRNTGEAETVSESDWQEFVDTQVAPRFPDGFTVEDASGAWRGGDGRTVRERTKRLLIVLKGAPDEPAKLAAIHSAYQTRFRQDSVMLLENEACAGF